MHKCLERGQFFQPRTRKVLQVAIRTIFQPCSSPAHRSSPLVLLSVSLPELTHPCFLARSVPAPLDPRTARIRALSLPARCLLPARSPSGRFPLPVTSALVALHVFTLTSGFYQRPVFLGQSFTSRLIKCVCFELENGPRLQKKEGSINV